MGVSANATAALSAGAGALGAGFYATEGSTTGTDSNWTGINTLGGTVSNSGTLTVTASAAASDTEVGASSAYATGIEMESSVNTATITNTGTLSVSAITGQGGITEATGIRILSFTPTNGTVPGVDDVLTINNNGGTIIARRSGDGGATWTHGVAIDTSDSPNPAVINLTGGAVKGVIYGGIDVSSVDTINVSSGLTEFDGVVNPGGELEGQLNIAATGTLYLKDKPWANTSYDGPSAVNVDDFNIAAGGTLAVDLPTAPVAADAELAYPVVTANTANITGGKLVVHANSSNGLYADSYTYNDVIVTPGDVLTGTGGLTGTFASVTTFAETPLLTFTALYNQNENIDGDVIGGDVDLVMTRVAFGAAPGLTVNQSSVGDGIENVYDPEMTGAFAGLVGDLFAENAAGYADALDQLSGEPYASYLQSMTGLASRFNGLIMDETDCAVIKIGETQPCRQETGGRIWGQINYGNLKKDGDAEAGGYKADDYYMALGVDFAVSPDTTVGIAAAWVKHDLNFRHYNAKIKSDGFQAGAYLVYDPGQLYAKAVLAYTDLNGKSRRSLAIGPSSTGTITGSPDAHAFSVSGELGYRMDMGGSTVTPYLNLEYDATKLKSFTETGLAAANLDVSGGSEDRFASQVGVKWAGQMGGLVPELKLGWRHQFGDRQATVGAAFDVVSGSDFDIISQSEKRDSAIVGLAIAGALSPTVSARLSYQGRINGDADSHAGGITIAMKLGGK
jgi:outer membrane autotransporter protein